MILSWPTSVTNDCAQNITYRRGHVIPLREKLTSLTIARTHVCSQWFALSNLCAQRFVSVKWFHLPSGRLELSNVNMMWWLYDNSHPYSSVLQQNVRRTQLAKIRLQIHSTVTGPTWAAMVRFIYGVVGISIAETPYYWDFWCVI